MSVSSSMSINLRTDIQLRALKEKTLRGNSFIGEKKTPLM